MEGPAARAGTILARRSLPDSVRGERDGQGEMERTPSRQP